MVVSGLRKLSPPHKEKKIIVSSDTPVRVAVLGASAVGKTSIIRQLVQNRFTERYCETIEDLYKHKIDQGSVYELDILDTSGSHEYASFRRKAIRTYDIFVLVFALNDKASFHEVKNIRNEILNLRKNVPIVVVGNKADAGHRFNKRHILEAIINFWDHSYFECSAKNDADVNKIFTEVAYISEGVERTPNWAIGGVTEGRMFVRSRWSTEERVEWIKLC